MSRESRIRDNQVFWETLSVADDHPCHRGPLRAGEVRSPLRRLSIGIPLDILNLMDQQEEPRGEIIRTALKLYFSLKDRIDKNKV